MLGKSPRPGFHTVTPYLIVRELAPMIEFLQQAFGATIHFQTTGGDGGSHTELRIGDSMVMMSGGENGRTVEPMPIMLFLYLADVDAAYKAALAAGATSLMEPTDGAFGEPRGAGIQDISGNQWYFANWAERPQAPPAFVEQTLAEPDAIPMLSYEDGPAAMDWLAAAFGFTEVERWLDDNGALAHGEMKTGLGNGRIMLASPTPHYQSPKRLRTHYAPAQKWSEAPWVINGVLVYVDDVDAHYARAVKAGATPLGEIEDGFPGRRYRTEDLEGHRWMFMQRASN
ncbi:MAG: VOC family protein [Caldilineaceae bacterium]